MGKGLWRIGVGLGLIGVACGQSVGSGSHDAGQERRVDEPDVGTCGNGVREGSERCDGDDLGGETCSGATTTQRPDGELLCSASCAFDTSYCVRLPPPSRPPCPRKEPPCPTLCGDDGGCRTLDRAIAEVRSTCDSIYSHGHSLRRGCGFVGVSVGYIYSGEITWFDEQTNLPIGTDWADDVGREECSGCLPPADCAMESCELCENRVPPGEQLCSVIANLLADGGREGGVDPRTDARADASDGGSSADSQMRGARR